MVVWLPLCLVLGMMHWICLLLDDLLFPGYRRVKVKEPLFIVGPPRSGTTFLHRVLAEDYERFAYFSFGEMVFMPSILQRKIVWLLDRIDRAFGSPVHRSFARVEKHFFDPYRHMHSVRLFEAEEDFVMLGYIFANHLLLTVFPYLDLLGHLWRFDHETPRQEQDRILKFYRRCLQRHLYYYGPEKTHLSKNPFFTPMIEGLVREFPDAKFLCNIRHPEATVPSFLSIWEALYGGIGNAPDHYLARDFVLDWLEEAYQYGGRQVDALGPDRGRVVRYEELVANPKAFIEALYDQFGWQPGDAFLVALDQESARAQSYESTHRYGIEQYGLGVDDLRARFAAVYEMYGFEVTQESKEQAGE